MCIYFCFKKNQLFVPFDLLQTIVFVLFQICTPMWPKGQIQYDTFSDETDL